MHKRLVFLSLMALMFVACSSDANVFGEYKPIKNGWDKNEKVSFEFQPKD